MDNRKLYKRLSTFFWFTLACLPVIIALIGFLGQYIGGVPDNYQGNSVFNTTTSFYRDFYYYFTNSTSNFREFVPMFIKSLFYNLNDLLDADMPYEVFEFVSWFVWVFMLQLLVDLFIWLPNFIHKGLEKWGA